MSRETWKKLNQLHTEKENFMSQKTSVKSSKTGTQMPLINVDAEQAPSAESKPVKARAARKVPAASKASAKSGVSPVATKATKPKTAKPKAPKVEQKADVPQHSNVERPLFKQGQRIFYLREPVVKTAEDERNERDGKNVRRKGRPFGCVAYEFTQLSDTMYSFKCGYSLVNKKFDSWDRAKARNIAIGRCSLNPIIAFDFTAKSASNILESLKEEFVSSSNYEVLFTLKEIRAINEMTRVKKAIDAKLAEYALRKNDGA